MEQKAALLNLAHYTMKQAKLVVLIAKSKRKHIVYKPKSIHLCGLVNSQFLPKV